MASDIWLRTILIVRKETRCRHKGYSYRLTARVLLYAPSHRQDNTYHGLCYTSRGALAGTRNSSMGPPHEGSIRRPIAPWAMALPLSYVPLSYNVIQFHIAYCSSFTFLDEVRACDLSVSIIQVRPTLQLNLPRWHSGWYIDIWAGRYWVRISVAAPTQDFFFFKKTHWVGRCKATTPSSLSLT